MRLYGTLIMIVAMVWIWFPELHLSTQQMLGNILLALAVLAVNSNEK